VQQSIGTDGSEFGERAHFCKALGLDNEECLARIPCLNDVELAESVPPFSLVRYRCLVQDIFEPEFYSGVLEEVDAGAEGGAPSRLVTSKYRECVEAAPGRALRELEDFGSLWQRGACYCVPLPGETAWSRAAASEWTCAGGGSLAFPLPAMAGANKRSRPDEDVSMEPESEVASLRPRLAEPPAANGSTVLQTAGQSKEGAHNKVGLKTAEDFGLNFPIPSEEQRGRGAATACIVKLYDADSEALHLCDTIEVIGILCVSPGMADLPDAETGKMEDDWRDARHPPTSLVPRLHALAVRQLPFHHPLLPYSASWLSEARLASAFQRQFAAAGAMLTARSAAAEHLSKCLGGDALAAEYLLMLLVSRSFAQHGEKLLGTWSLNLAGCPEGFDADALREAAAELVPRAVHLEVNPASLNSQRWRVRKDFVANRLVSSQLQLAAGTLLMLDETKMTEGELTADGYKALESVKSLVTENKLSCDFQSYDVNIPLEVASVLLSRRKSLVKDVDVLLPMQTSAGLASNAVAPEAISSARWLLALVTRSPRPVIIPDEVTHVFSEDFARARQEFKVKPELAHTWVGLARARCLTFGENELSMQRWREVMEMEQARLCRCREQAMLE